ncbi:hypothetical protein [Sphingomonas sp.]|uniref:hypothetical protein n=1 Tax=Sphingomonas sp. TaxID=28214 RepID=UPI003B3AD383
MKTEIEFDDLGKTVVAVYLDGQRYDYRGTHQHQKIDGSMTLLVDWETNCPECGTAFVTSSTRRTPMAFTRRCSEHRVAGKNVSKKHPRFAGKRKD